MKESKKPKRPRRRNQKNMILEKSRGMCFKDEVVSGADVAASHRSVTIQQL